LTTPYIVVPAALRDLLDPPDFLRSVRNHHGGLRISKRSVVCKVRLGLLRLTILPRIVQRKTPESPERLPYKGPLSPRPPRQAHSAAPGLCSWPGAPETGWLICWCRGHSGWSGAAASKSSWAWTDAAAASVWSNAVHPALWLINYCIRDPDPEFDISYPGKW